MTHTQGPWFIRKNFNGCGALDLFGEGGQTIIGNALLINQEANARLIAAAPDMLAALENLLALTELHIAERSKTPEEEDTFLACHHITQTRAAIAKARGA